MADLPRFSPLNSSQQQWGPRTYMQFSCYGSASPADCRGVVGDTAVWQHAAHLLLWQVTVQQHAGLLHEQDPEQQLAELDRLCKLKVIEPVDMPMPCLSQLALTKKKNGQIRILSTHRN